MNSLGYRWLLVLLLCFGWQQVPALEDPARLVQETADQVLAEVRQRRAELEKSPYKISELVDQIILPRFDFNYMSRLVLGKHWRRASPLQRDSFVKAFQELLVRTYSTALLTYADQNIQYLPVHRGRDDTKVTVNTEVVVSGGPPVPIDYRLYIVSGEWKVYDVTIDGISLVSNYRSSFASQIRRLQLDGLIEKVQQMNERQL